MSSGNIFLNIFAIFLNILAHGTLLWASGVQLDHGTSGEFAAPADPNQKGTFTVMPDNLWFLRELAAGLTPDERLILCSFPGDPNAAPPHAWRPQPWRPGLDLAARPEHNAYVTVGAFGRAPDGTYRRRRETFTAGLALMVDDVGTKVSRLTVADAPPSWAIETSPGNEQWWYFFKHPERDVERFDGLIRAFISRALLGADPGMSGVTRVGRLPGHLNGKAAYGGWTTRRIVGGGRRWSPDELLEVFGLQLNGRRYVRSKLPTADALERNRTFATVYKWLGQRRMLKRQEPDPSGWTEMRCPWVDEHTGGVDNGTGLREPAPENDWTGAWRCHHGHCIDKGWRHLTEWIAEQSVEELERAAAGSTHDDNR